MEYANPTFFPLHHFERMLHTTDSLATSFILITACRDCSQVIVAHLWLSVAEKQLSKTTLRLASLGVPFNSSGAARCGDLKDCCRGRLVEGVLYPFNSSDAYSELFRQRIHSLLRGRYRHLKRERERNQSGNSQVGDPVFESSNGQSWGR
jgi:hypothetical protein